MTFNNCPHEFFRFILTVCWKVCWVGEMMDLHTNRLNFCFTLFASCLSDLQRIQNLPRTFIVFYFILFLQLLLMCLLFVWASRLYSAAVSVRQNDWLMSSGIVLWIYCFLFPSYWYLLWFSVWWCEILYLNYWRCWPRD